MNCFALALAAVLSAQAPQDEVDRLRKELEKLKADNAVVLRQLEVSQALLKELNDKLARAQNEKKAAVGGSASTEQVERELSEARAFAEHVQNWEKLRRGAQALGTPAKVPVAPAPMGAPRVYYERSLPEGRITAVANEIDLVVVSVGSDDGVVEGQTFSITREGQPVGTLTIDRADRKWAAGKVSKKSSNARVGDAIGVEKPISSPKATPSLVMPGSARLDSPDELRSIRKELDEVRSQVRQLSDQIIPAWQGPGVSVDEASEELRAHLSLPRGLLVRRVREGSRAEKAGLKVNDVVPDLLEAQLLQAIETGLPIHVIRQGQRVRLAGATNK
jgi:hypothetical protein